MGMLADGIRLFREEQDSLAFIRAGMPSDATTYTLPDLPVRHEILCRVAPRARCIVYGADDGYTIAKHPCGWFFWRAPRGQSPE